MAFKAKSLVSIYYQFFLARIYERTLKNYQQDSYEECLVTT